MTIQQLRKSGYKVKVLHFRNSVIKNRMNSSVVSYESPKGGSTQIIIDSPDGKHFIGEAICSKQDNYNKKLGVRIAMGRSGIYDYLRASHTY